MNLRYLIFVFLIISTLGVKGAEIQYEFSEPMKIHVFNLTQKTYQCIESAFPKNKTIDEILNYFFKSKRFITWNIRNYKLVGNRKKYNLQTKIADVKALNIVVNVD